VHGGAARGARCGRGERGSVTLWVLGLCVAVLFVGGLALDLWRALAVRRELAAAADAAATAGANGLDPVALRRGAIELDPGRARMLATESLRGRPGHAALDGADIAVRGDTVEVQLADGVDFSLLAIFLGGRRFEVSARAVARAEERG